MVLLQVCYVFVLLSHLYLVEIQPDKNKTIKAGTGSLSPLSVSLVPKQGYMEIAREESELGSVRMWQICQHACVLKDSVENERLRTQESRAHMNKLALH